MTRMLTLSIGQHTDKGRKDTNQDFHGYSIPSEPLLSTKGIVVALADGISSSPVSHLASESAIRSFLEDYYCTSEAWSVKTSAERVLGSTNAWLYSQTRRGHSRYDKDKGYICTLSAVVFKGDMAYLFHIGDSRIYRLRDGALEQLTTDHRSVSSAEESHLSRAMGFDEVLEVDHRSLTLKVGDIFLLATDGLYEWAPSEEIIEHLQSAKDDLDAVALRIAASAMQRGCDDNLTLQIARIESLPDSAGFSAMPEWASLPPAPILQPRMLFDGYRILRELHGSSRSHIYLAEDEASGTHVVLKIPSVDLRDEPGYLERFMLEEWIARRINNAHVLKPCPITRQRNYLYISTEYVEGKTLAQWMVDNPRPELEAVRGIVEQIARGLRAFHRLEMLHQDLRPNNIMIDHHGTVKIIDFGATRVSGLVEAEPSGHQEQILGTVQYTAPEYFLGDTPTQRADLFSLGVITYQMLSGRLPYGAQVSQKRTRAAVKKLRYKSVLDDTREIPSWIDAALAKAVHPDPWQRYDDLSEFTHDLRYPNQTLLGRGSLPLIERNPLVFWQVFCAILVVIIGVLLATHK